MLSKMQTNVSHPPPTPKIKIPTFSLMMSNPFLTAPILGELSGAGTYSAVKLPEEDSATHEKHSTAASFRR